MSDLTDAAVAAEFGCSREYVQIQCREGRWPFYRIGRRYFFTAADLEQIKALSRTEPKAEDEAADSWGQKKRGAA